MQAQTDAWTGTIIAVHQLPDRCRVTIELAGDPSVTAALMKESSVSLEVLSASNKFLK